MTALSVASTNSPGCGHRLWDEPDGLPCTRIAPHDPGRGCCYENGSWVDDDSRVDGGHG
ncbi:MAG: hypothetical protein L0H93_07585 [Nocardioides sp.]|nr:hypothetical protein [Nocardioides sp.]